MDSTNTPPTYEAALVVVIPAADHLVADWSLPAGDTSAFIPAHVTVLFPFKPPLDGDAAALIAEVAAGIDPFEVTFARSDRFPGEFVYLVPEPAQPFLDLTNALVEAFPECPPYGGAHDDVIPHLTIARDLEPAEAKALQDDLALALPVVAPVTHLTLLKHDGESTWRSVHSWPLGPTPEITPGDSPPR